MLGRDLFYVGVIAYGKSGYTFFAVLSECVFSDENRFMQFLGYFQPHLEDIIHRISVLGVLDAIAVG